MSGNDEANRGLIPARHSFSSLASNPTPVDTPSITVKDTLHIIFSNAGIMTHSSDFVINAIMANSDSCAEGQQDIVATTALIGTLQRLADITMILSFIAPLILLITSVIFPRQFIFTISWKK